MLQVAAFPNVSLVNKVAFELQQRTRGGWGQKITFFHEIKVG